jgi:hypothetical protein
MAAIKFGEVNGAHLLAGMSADTANINTAYGNIVDAGKSLATTLPAAEYKSRLEKFSYDANNRGKNYDQNSVERTNSIVDLAQQQGIKSEDLATIGAGIKSRNDAIYNNNNKDQTKEIARADLDLKQRTAEIKREGVVSLAQAAKEAKIDTVNAGLYKYDASQETGKAEIFKDLVNSEKHDLDELAKVSAAATASGHPLTLSELQAMTVEGFDSNWYGKADISVKNPVEYMAKRKARIEKGIVDGKAYDQLKITNQGVVDNNLLDAKQYNDDFKHKVGQGNLRRTQNANEQFNPYVSKKQSDEYFYNANNTTYGNDGSSVLKSRDGSITTTDANGVKTTQTAAEVAAANVAASTTVETVPDGKGGTTTTTTGPDGTKTPVDGEGAVATATAEASLKSMQKFNAQTAEGNKLSFEKAVAAQKAEDAKPENQYLKFKQTQAGKTGGQDNNLISQDEFMNIKNNVNPEFQENRLAELQAKKQEKYDFQLSKIPEIVEASTTSSDLLQQKLTNKETAANSFSGVGGFDTELDETISNDPLIQEVSKAFGKEAGDITQKDLDEFLSSETGSDIYEQIQLEEDSRYDSDVQKLRNTTIPDPTGQDVASTTTAEENIKKSLTSDTALDGETLVSDGSAVNPVFSGELKQTQVSDNLNLDFASGPEDFRSDKPPTTYEPFNGFGGEDDVVPSEEVLPQGSETLPVTDSGSIPQVVEETQATLNEKTGSKLVEDGLGGPRTTNATEYYNSKPPTVEKSMEGYSHLEEGDVALQREESFNVTDGVINRRGDSKFTKQGTEKALELNKILREGGFSEDDVYFSSNQRNTRQEMEVSVQGIINDTNNETYKGADYVALQAKYQAAEGTLAKAAVKEEIFQRYKQGSIDSGEGHYEGNGVDLVTKTGGDPKKLKAMMAYLKKMNVPGFSMIDETGKAGPHIHIQWENEEPIKE